MKFKGIELENNRSKKLTSLEIGLTSSCNFKCKYCCKYSTKDDKYISAEDCIKIIKDLDRLERVKLSGGEVLLYFDECVRLINYCKERGMLTQVNTNGSLLNGNKVKALEDAGLNILHFSLDFLNPEDYVNYYNQSDSMFFKILSNIKNSLNCTNLDTIVETIVFKETEDELLNMHKFLTDLGVKKHEIQLAIPIDSNKWNNLTDINKLFKIVKDLILKKDKDSEIYFSCFRKNIPEEILKKMLDLAAEKESNVFFPDCIEGKNQLHLHCNGDILICELGYPKVIGNVFKGTDLNSIHQTMPKELEEFISNHSCRKEYYQNSRI